MKKNKTAVIAILVFTFIFSGLNSDSAGQKINADREAKYIPMTFLSVKGNKIVDESGKEIKLRGMHHHCFYAFRKDVYDAIKENGEDPDHVNIDLFKHSPIDYDISEFQKMGANVVRIDFRLWQIEKKPYTYSETSLMHLDRTIEQWGRKGIYVVLDMHAAGQNDLLHNKEYGNIIWKNAQFRDRVVSLWGMLANRYKDNPYIAGYDIINEPRPPSKEALHDLYEKIIRDIRKNDKKHIIILECDQRERIEIAFGGKYDDPNIVHSIHFYKPGKFTNPRRDAKNPGSKYPAFYDGIFWDREQINKFFLEVLSKFGDRPLFVGEFGAAYMNRSEDAFQWIKDVIAVLNNNGIHYTFFTYKWPQRDSLGLYQPQKNVSNKMLFLNSSIKNKRMSIKHLTEADKLMGNTAGNYEAPQNLMQILSQGFSQEAGRNDGADQ